MLSIYFVLLAGNVDNGLATQTEHAAPLWVSLWPLALIGIPLLVGVSAVLGYGLATRPSWSRVVAWLAISAGVFGLVVLAGAWQHADCSSWLFSGTLNCRDHSAWVRETLQWYRVPLTLFTALPALVGYAIGRLWPRARGRHARGVERPSEQFATTSVTK